MLTVRGKPNGLFLLIFVNIIFVNMLFGFNVFIDKLYQMQFPKRHAGSCARFTYNSNKSLITKKNLKKRERLGKVKLDLSNKISYKLL